MSVKYRCFDGEQVSELWFTLLRDIREVGGVQFYLNEGHRTLARQRELFNQNMHRVNGRWVPKFGRPLTAAPSNTAPHIRAGRHDHALDVVRSKGAIGGTPAAFIRAAAERGVKLTFTVPGESWHVETTTAQLQAYAANRKLRRRDAMTRLVSRRGVDLIADFEGFRGYVYADAAGHATVGFGHLLHFGPPTASDIAVFGTKDSPKLSRAQAALLLRTDIETKAESHVRALVKVPVTQNEFDALVSLVFNIGGGAFAKSTVLRELNLRHRRRAAAAFLLWNKAGGKVLLGLSRRRRAERRLFLEKS